MRDLVLGTLGLWSLTSLCAPEAAHAQPATVATPRGPGRDALDRGILLIRQEHWLEAVTTLEESVALEPGAPLAWYHLALACERAGRPACTLDAFEHYLDAPEPGANAQRLADIRARFTRLMPRVTHVPITLSPPNATLQVDGRPWRLPGGELRVDPGLHVLRIEAPGYEPLRREESLQSNTRTLDFRLNPSSVRSREAPVVAAPVSPTSPVQTRVLQTTGQLIVEPSVATASILVDGTSQSTGSLTLPVGLHRIEVRANGYQSWSRTVQVIAGGTARQPVTLIPSGGGRGWVLPTALAGGAVVATAVIVGIAIATRGVAGPMPGGWDSVQE